MVQPISSKFEATGFVDSRIGGRQENQDCAGVRDTAIGLLVVVCDGMGGMQGGQIASTTAVTTIMSFFENIDKQADPAMTLVKAINEANAQIIAKGQEDPNLRGMGTTVTALLKTPKSAIVAHVGDSRIYQFRGGKKVFRTFDHSMVFEMVKKKVLTEEQARLSAQSNVILKALGVKPEVEVECQEIPYLKGDRFVLCSDGFWGAMPEEDFIALVTKKANANQVLTTTANKVEAIGKEKGGDYDNLTAAIVEIESNSKMQVKMNTLAKTIIGLLSVLLIASLGLNCYGYFVNNNIGMSSVGDTEKTIDSMTIVFADSACTIQVMDTTKIFNALSIKKLGKQVNTQQTQSKPNAANTLGNN